MAKQQKPTFGAFDEDDTGYDMLGAAMLIAAMIVAIALLIAVQAMG